MHHCMQCGSNLELHLHGGREREMCGECGWIYYPQLKVGAGVLIEKEGGLLLLQRAYNPWQGDWNLPAGYVEVDESPRAAAKREAMEETGLNVEVGELVQEYFFDDDPRGNGVLFLYRAKTLNGKLTINNEVRASRYFSWQEIPVNLAGGGHDRAVLDWRAQAQEKYGG